MIATGTATPEPTTPNRCAWCGAWLPAEDLAFIEGTEIPLCAPCLARYEGNEGDEP